MNFFGRENEINDLMALWGKRSGSLVTCREIWRGQTLRGCGREGEAMPEEALAVDSFLSPF